ncbi:periplasmic nitrate reductase, NapE protein [Luteimonas sp. TWI1416]|uniref:periplasmic nitrate reductase, NapE protein n=1 Tax=unclassified Luteimonas TaxID=2629088 RepID=UPI00320A9573
MTPESQEAARLATPAQPADPRRAKRKELLLFLFITVVMFPILSVLIVASYGFSVWFWQMFTGPPTY